MRFFLACGATSLLVVLACASRAVEYAPRTWTNDKGETIEASLKRLSGGTAILDHNGEVIRAPITRLSEADKQWIKSVREVNRWREWTMADGSTRRAKLESFADGKLNLKDQTESFTLTLAQVSDADRAKLAEVFDSIQAATDETPGLQSLAGDTQEYGSSRSSSGSPVLPSNNWTINNGPVRSWTDVDGKTIDAELRGVDGDKVILFFKQREWRVPKWRLSDADQNFVANQRLSGNAQNTIAEAGASGPRVDQPNRGSYNSAMNAVRGRMNPGLTMETSHGGARAHNEMRARMQEHMEQARRDADERMAQMRQEQETRMAEMEQQRQERERQRQEELAELERQQQEQMAAAASPPDQFASDEMVESGYDEPQYPTSTFDDASEGMWVNQYQCFTCNKTWESAREYGAGDKCPHCGAVFDYMEDENGEVVEESSRYTARKWRGIIKLGIFLVIAVCGFLAKMARG